MGNNNLAAARRKKNDEFYTRICDIEAELRWYQDHFEDQVVYCNCDNIEQSNFVKFFQAKFIDYKLKKLIVTYYVEAGTSRKMIMDAPDNIVITDLSGDGSFASQECLELLDEADIVVTNPPFSLFREFISLLTKKEKRFLVLGNNNAITYKEIFPLIKEGKIWLGLNSNKTLEFKLHSSYKKWSRVDEKGNKYGKVPAISWFTNLVHYKRNTPILLYKQYSPQEYSRYDNYDAIEVSKVKNIPVSYEGVMGVPITFLDKYCPDQFEIIGATESEGKGFSNGIWNSESNVSQALVNNKKVYKRLLIKHKKDVNAR